MSHNDMDDINLIDFFKEIWVFKWLLILLVVVAVGVSGFHAKFLVSPEYKAETVLFSRYTNQISFYIASRGFRGRVIDQLASYPSEEVSKAVNSLSDSVSRNLITIHVRGSEHNLVLEVLDVVLEEVDLFVQNIVGYDLAAQREYLNEINHDLDINTDLLELTEQKISSFLNSSDGMPDKELMLVQFLAIYSNQLMHRNELLKEKARINEMVDQPSFIVVSQPFAPVASSSASYIFNMFAAAFLALFAGVTVIFLKMLYANYSRSYASK